MIYSVSVVRLSLLWCIFWMPFHLEFAYAFLRCLPPFLAHLFFLASLYREGLGYARDQQFIRGTAQHLTLLCFYSSYVGYIIFLLFFPLYFWGKFPLLDSCWHRETGKLWTDNERRTLMKTSWFVFEPWMMWFNGMSPSDHLPTKLDILSPHLGPLGVVRVPA